MLLLACQSELIIYAGRRALALFSHEGGWVVLAKRLIITFLPVISMHFLSFQNA